MKRFLKILAVMVLVLILSAVSAYALYIILLLTGIVSYYELSPPSENIQCDIALAASFISFFIIYSVIAKSVIFKKNIDNKPE
ncbi:MAG: hypothetical protein NC397_07800 [Clostridium sp.]|nr:hypothetical protein [Clostridium sp.]